MNDLRIYKFRSFVIAIHDEYGCLLLKSSKKGKSGYFQLPGGRLDERDLLLSDFKVNGVPGEDSFKVAAARELYEETGLDFRNKLQLLKPLNFDLPEKWRFFYLNITYYDLEGGDKQNTDDDDNSGFSYFKPIQLVFEYLSSIFKDHSNGSNFQLKLSSEHEDFMFEKDLVKASKLVKYHSKGISSRALLLYKQSYQRPTSQV